MKLIRQGQDPATTAMSLAAAVILTATVVVLLAVPKPTTAGLQQRYKNRSFELSLLRKKAQDTLTQQQNTVIKATWSVPEQKVGPLALATVTSLVRQNNLKLVAFRPQRRNDDGSIVQLPYMLTVDGPFPNLISLMDQLEKPTTKLAANLVQVASAEDASNRVTASIGLVAYLSPSKEEQKTNG